MRRVVTVAAAMMLSGCAVMDTGEIDYRKAETLTGTDIAKEIADYRNKCGLKEQIKNKDQPCLPLLPAALFRQNASGTDPILANQVYSIRLEHGLIAYITEPGFSFRRIAASKDPFRQIGEVVVLANTFEFGTPDSPKQAGDSATAGASVTPPQFLDLTRLSSAKVIYYSPDVEVEQDLNFSNIPLQPPTVYGGNPVGIQIVVLELDRMSSQMQALVKQLASLGQVSNLAPSGPAGALLLELGSSLLTQDHDDVIFEYRFVLDPLGAPTSTPVAGSASFEAGRYVLRRSDERRSEQVWRNLRLDHNTGKLYHMEKSDVATEYTDDTYFTLNVIRHPQGTLPSTFGFKTLDQLGTDIKAAADLRDAAPRGVTINVEKSIRAVRSDAWLRDLVKSWNEVDETARSYARLYMTNVPVASCPLAQRKSDDPKLSLLEINVRSATIRFLRLYAKAMADQMTDTAGSAKSTFETAEQERVLDAMTPFFIPLAGGNVTTAELTDAAAFASAYVQPNTVPFQDEVIDAARRNWAPKTCDDLKALNLFVY
jgi:hypothetical protein